MGDTRSIGIAYRDQDLDGSTIANATITNATITASASTITTLTATNANVTTSNVTTANITTANTTTENVTNLVVGVGGKISVDNAAVSATGNDTTQTATVTKTAGIITTGALTTAANATTAVVLTLTGVAAGDIAICTMAGGTNTVAAYIQSAICTTNTITVTLRNGVNATTALNGTVAFNYLWVQ